MSDARERLKKLYSEMGLETEEGITAAEIEACVAGINMVLDDYSECMDRIFIPNGKIHKVYEYTELMGRYVLSIGVHNRETIATRIAGPTGVIFKNELEGVMKCINYYFSYTINDGIITFDEFDKNDLGRIGDFISGYVPISLTPTIKGKQSDFSKWDDFKKAWYVLDGYGFPFSVIEKMEVNKYE